MWDDPAIAKDNPGMKLPAEPITVVHRADGSGTTYTWVDYLSKMAGEFKEEGRAWAPPSPGRWAWAARATRASAARCKPDPGLHRLRGTGLRAAEQDRLRSGEERRRRVRERQPGLRLQGAAATAKIPADYRVSITNAPGKGVYPVSTFTWILVSPALPDGSKKKALHDFLVWAVTKGQNDSKGLGYAPLPKALVKRELKDLAKLD